MDDVKWIKLKVGMFDGSSFKRIRRAKIGGESYRDKLTAIWFELMDFAGKCNHNGAFVNHKEIPYTDLEDIAIMIDREVDELQLCMSFYVKEGMVEIIDDVYKLTNWSEYQNEEALEQIRENKRLRQARWREKKRMEASFPELHDVSVDATQPSTECLPSYADDSDDLLGMTQMPPPTYQRITIPLEKAMHFRTRSRKDNPEGRSILRTAYRAYYFKKRLEEIEGYGMERDLAGFPVLYSPQDINIWDSEDEEMREVLARAEYIVSSIRRDAREGLVLPGGENGWKLELVSSGSRRQFDTNAIIDRYDKRIATSVLADFVMLGQQAVGSFALADSKTQIFAMAIGTYLDVICEVFNNQGIPRLIDINGDHFKGISDYPHMVHGDIDEPDLANFAAFIEKMVGAGVLIPDEGLEEEVRRIGHLPEKVETDAPTGDRSTPAQTDAERKAVYKITSILEKYQEGKTTRDAAAQLLGSLDLTPEQVEFYLKEAEKAPHDGGDSSASAAKPAGKDNTQAEDEQDAKAADEAKKSLGRGM